MTMTFNRFIMRLVNLTFKNLWIFKNTNVLFIENFFEVHSFQIFDVDGHNSFFLTI